MRASDLLGADVVDATGRSLGPVRDLRVTPDGMEVVGLVIGDGLLAGMAHAWGYTEGRALGPWALRALTAQARRRARFVPSHRVLEWGPSPVRVSGAAEDLPHLHEETKQ